MRILTAFLVLAAFLPSCRSATVDDSAVPGGPPTRLAVQPGALPSDLPAGVPAASKGATPRSSTPSSSPSRSSVGPYATRGTLADAKGDAGIQTPGYADLLGVTIEDNGHSLRITVDVAASVANPMPSGEQMSIGVDLYRGNTAESDYQVYAQGTADGWYAYLDTPSGVVDNPGTFAIGGKRLVLTVPKASLGARAITRISVYSDWDRRGAVVNTVGADRAPNRGSKALTTS